MMYPKGTAKEVAIQLVKLLIEAGSYNSLGGDFTAEQILKDIETLTEGITDK